jgi:hypothetical protein
MGAHRLDTLRARRLLGGLSVQELAKRAGLTDLVVEDLESGASCQPEVTQRILDVLAPAVPLASNTQANPTVFTVTNGHSFQSLDTVVIAGNITSNADPNGTRVVTRINGTTFSVPVDCSVAGGTLGTATLQPASVGIARLT